MILTETMLRPDEMMWIAVSIIEDAQALKLQWHNSSIRSYFLHSLNIDENRVRCCYSLMRKNSYTGNYSHCRFLIS